MSGGRLLTYKICVFKFNLEFQYYVLNALQTLLKHIFFLYLDAAIYSLQSSPKFTSATNVLRTSAPRISIASESKLLGKTENNCLHTM